MRKVIVDANLLCLLIAGHFAPDAIGRHKRLRAYSLEDFDALMLMTSGFDQAVTCPNILTETSNLLAGTNDSERTALLTGLKIFLKNTHERHVPSIIACDNAAYSRLGLTDAVLLTLELSDAVLLTVDLGLTLAAESVGRTVVNYNRIRDNPANRAAFGLP